MRIALIGLCALLCCGACVSAPEGRPVTALDPSLAIRPVQADYRISPGDVLDIKLFYNPELNETIMVRPDGRIALQLAGEIMAAGLTPEELRKTLSDRYSKEINRPDITVIVRSFNMQRAYIDGEVVRPGMLPLAGPVTVHQAVAAAGGFKESARRTDVIIIRRPLTGPPVPLKVDMERVLEGDNAQDILLAPFDIVYVPRSAIAEVNKFVDLYLRRNIPVGAGVGVGWTLNNN